MCKAKTCHHSRATVWERQVTLLWQFGKPGTFPPQCSLQASDRVMELDHSDGKLKIQYSDRLVTLLKEVRQLSALGFTIPAKFQQVANTADRFYRQALVLKQVVFRFSSRPSDIQRGGGLVLMSSPFIAGGSFLQHNRPADDSIPKANDVELCSRLRTSNQGEVDSVGNLMHAVRSLMGKQELKVSFDSALILFTYYIHWCLAVGFVCLDCFPGVKQNPKSHSRESEGRLHITWESPKELELYISKLQTAAERLSVENRKLRRWHKDFTEKVWHFGKAVGPGWCCWTKCSIPSSANGD